MGVPVQKYIKVTAFATPATQLNALACGQQNP
jgi:hypothetical protein